MLAELLLDKEEGEFKIIRRRRLKLDAERLRIQGLVDQDRAEADVALNDIPILLTYLNALATQIGRLRDEGDALTAEEHSQKGRLKTALARQLRLEESES